MSTASDEKPTKQGRIAQVRQAYTAIKSLDPKLGRWMLLAAVLTLAVFVGLGLILGDWWKWYLPVTGIPAALLAATIVMNRRGNRAMYDALDGKVGAVGAALTGMGKRGWYTSDQPVSVDAPRTTKMSDMVGAAMVFRALGRPGIVLIAEGPKGKAMKLLKTEEKKTARVAPGVPIHLWMTGEGEDEVEVRKISTKLTKMKPVLTKDEVAVVNKRLKSLGGLRPGIPAGMDPTRQRMDRRAMRGK